MRLLFVFLVLLFSCNNEASDEATNTAQSLNSPKPNKTLSANVEGMVCKMGCAASIRKELNALDGVDEVRIDFVKDRAKQELTVLYNDTKINQELIISSIETINKKQFVVSDLVSENIIE
tara:strand:- start:706 stop:1065 length:360 start_codon:yes stop_codon:yes gene_type:complete